MSMTLRNVTRSVAAGAVLVLASLPVGGSGVVQASERVEIERDGLTLFGFLETVAPAEEGIVLMLHGTLAHGQMEVMQGVQQLLSDQGMNSLAVNLSYGIDRREGMFACDQPIRHGLEDHFGELDAWLGWLSAAGYESVHLFGHSRGGNQVARYWSERSPAAVQSLMLLAPSTFDPERAADNYGRVSALPLQVRLDQAQELLRMGQPETLIEDARFLYCESLSVTPQAFLGYYRIESDHDTPTVITDNGISTLVMIGSEDDVVPELPARMAALGDSPIRTTVTIDGADHFFRDFFADDVVEAMMDFIR